MRNSTQKSTLFIFLLVIIQTSFGQKFVDIKDNVSDKKSPIEFVSVVLKNVNDSTKVVSYTTTDRSGNYTLEKVL